MCGNNWAKPQGTEVHIALKAMGVPKVACTRGSQAPTPRGERHRGQGENSHSQQAGPTQAANNRSRDPETLALGAGRSQGLDL